MLENVQLLSSLRYERILLVSLYAFFFFYNGFDFSYYVSFIQNCVSMSGASFDPFRFCVSCSNVAHYITYNTFLAAVFLNEVLP